MTLHALNRWAELHFAQSVRQLKVQFVRYDQKGVETTVSNNMCVCVLCWRDVNDPARPVCNTTLYQQEAVFIEFQETQKNIP